MKKAFLFLLVTVFALSFNACSDDDDNGTEPGKDKKKVTVSVFYRMENSDYDYPDSNSKIHIFRNTGFMADKFKYESGKFYNKESGGWTDPVQSLTNDNNVLIEVDVDYDCTIVAESSHYEGKYEIKEKSLKDKDRTIKIVFPAQ